jgi:ATP-dependent Clp protease ATP-binding subunit ClpA
MGFTDSKAAGDEMADIKRMFTPEFRNRIDATISFRALDEEIILRVVDKFLMQLEEQLHEKKVEAIFTEKLRKFLAKKGFDPLMGARPMARLIQDMIRKALADELLFGRLVNGGKVTVDMDDKDRHARVPRGRRLAAAGAGRDGRNRVSQKPAQAGFFYIAASAAANPRAGPPRARSRPTAGSSHR